jgi:hypothetical protein
VRPCELTAAVLAGQVGADRLILPANRWHPPEEGLGQPRILDTTAARRLRPSGQGDRSRLEAVCGFVEATGQRAMIGERHEAGPCPLGTPERRSWPDRKPGSKARIESRVTAART